MTSIKKSKNVYNFTDKTRNLHKTTKENAPCYEQRTEHYKNVQKNKNKTVKFWYLARVFFYILSFSSSERFWYLSCASFQSLSFCFNNNYLPFLNIQKKIIHQIFFLYALKNKL